MSDEVEKLADIVETLEDQHDVYVEETFIDGADMGIVEAEIVFHWLK